MGERRLAKLKYLMDLHSQRGIVWHLFTLPQIRVFIACLFIPFVAWWQMDDERQI